MKQTMFARLHRQLYRRPVWCMSSFLLLHTVLFQLLERLPRQVHLLHCPADDWLPFYSGAIWPYLGWFLWVPGMLFWLLRRDKAHFCRCFGVLALGDALTLVLYAVWPTGLALRGQVAGSGLSSELVRLLYRLDSPANVCPSLHIFITFVLWLALWDVLKIPGRCLHTLLALAICLSTVLLDQHSIIDVLAALLLGAVLWQGSARPRPGVGRLRLVHNAAAWGLTLYK